MSDPRKTFVCRVCGCKINDKYREWGKETPCPRCEQIKFENKMRDKYGTR
jgi:rubrerythrin